ncbi:MAG: pyridoxal phosphate-dependent decarboxylase family protein [Vicinamibacteria bacterium]
MTEPSPAAAYPLEPEGEGLEALTQACVRFVLQHVETLGTQPAADVADARALAESFREAVPESGSKIDVLLARLGPAVAKSYNAAGPGYLAYIPGGGVYAAALADFIACAVNRYVGVAAAAPVLARIEETVLRWLAALMGYPETAGGILTSGGSLSNLSAIVTAREALLGEDLGLGRLYVSEDTHHCVAKAARIAGLWRESVVVLPVDDRRRLIPEALAEAVGRDREKGLRPFLVAASVGTTNTGAIDPLRAIVGIARAHGLWVHADAAYGGFFRLVAAGEDLLDGLEACDSITLDPHKGLFLPYGTGCLLVRDRDLLRRAHQGGAEYLQDAVAELDGPSFADLSPELSRDFRGLRLWLPIQLHGLGAFREQLQEKLDLARLAYDALRQDELFEMVDEPQLSIVAFRLRGTGPEADARSAELLRRVNARGRVFLSSTRLGGRYTLRICVLSFRTHEERIRDAIVALREEARAISHEATDRHAEPAR